MNKTRLGFRRALVPLCLAGMMLPASAFSLEMYSSIPDPLPGSLPSLGYQATQTAELGDHVAFEGPRLPAQRIIVNLNSWACPEGGWVDGSCTHPESSPPGFVHPITLNIYEVDNSGAVPAVGSIVHTVTEEFLIPWRPASDPECENGGYLPDCNNGYNFLITFDFGPMGLELPKEIIYGIAFNTQTWGYDPIGEDGPYTSLNFALSEGATAGIDVDPDMLFWNTETASWYTDGGAAGVGVFRADTNWTGYVPSVRIEANDPAAIPANNPLALSILVMLMLAGGLYFRRTV